MLLEGESGAILENGLLGICVTDSFEAVNCLLWFGQHLCIFELEELSMGFGQGRQHTHHSGQFQSELIQWEQQTSLYIWQGRLCLRDLKELCDSRLKDWCLVGRR